VVGRGNLPAEQLKQKMLNKLVDRTAALLKVVFDRA
jgi:hypothetical protein